MFVLKGAVVLLVVVVGVDVLRGTASITNEQDLDWSCAAGRMQPSEGQRMILVVLLLVFLSLQILQTPLPQDWSVWSPQTVQRDYKVVA